MDRLRYQQLGSDIQLRGMGMDMLDPYGNQYQQAYKKSNFDESSAYDNGVPFPNINENVRNPAATPRNTVFGTLARWTKDMLALATALVSFLAIVITLRLHDNRPLPNWPFSISVNALISVFSTILKGTMLYAVAGAISQLKFSWFREQRPLMDLVRFDDASRGVWGSLILIARLRGLHLGSLGAVIGVIALANDPLIQQVVRYRPCAYVDFSGTATIPRTSNYSVVGFHNGALQRYLDIPMQAAIYKGVYNSFTAPAPTCTTGNCTFPLFRTVGVCGGCQDFSDQIQYSLNTSTDASDQTAVSNWKLGTALQLNNSYESLAVTVMDTYYQDWNITTTISTTQLLTFTYSEDYFTKGDFSGEFQGYHSVLGAQCVLKPCVRTYNASVSQGNPTLELLSTAPMVQQFTSEEYNLAPFFPYYGSPMPCLINGSYFDATAFTKQNETNVNAVWGLLPNNQTAYLPDECYFSFADALGPHDYLETVLTGWGTDFGEEKEWEPNWLGVLYNGGNADFQSVNATWNNLAESMTQYVHRRVSACLRLGHLLTSITLMLGIYA